MIFGFTICLKYYFERAKFYITVQVIKNSATTEKKWVQSNEHAQFVNFGAGWKLQALTLTHRRCLATSGMRWFARPEIVFSPYFYD